MKDIPLKVLIIDPETNTRHTLAKILRGMEVVLYAKECRDLAAASDILKKAEINVIYVDPISLGIEPASSFVFRLRKDEPTIVFVLFVDSQKRKKKERDFYNGERRRWRHYFYLNKVAKPGEFVRQVHESSKLCQSELAMTLTQEKIASLQKELINIQQGASNDKATVPLQTIKDMLEQLAARKLETITVGTNKAAEFLGTPSAPGANGNQCFIVMPYSQSWSKPVEEILRESCETAGIEFTIAKAMDGRFVAHDIWQSITGSNVIVADLSGANANVSYEIGLADAIGREVILISQDTKIPFDFSGHRLILYENSVEGALKLRKEVTARLKAILAQLKLGN